MAVIILARSTQNYPSVGPTSQEGFGVTELRLSASVSLSPSWILPVIRLLWRKFLPFSNPLVEVPSNVR
jgi:hypothetical protein